MLLASSREVKCPKCHGPFQLPLKGVEDLPTNYFTAGVVSASIKKESVDPNNVKCGLCEENDATVHCIHCPAFLCNGCNKAHLKLPASSHHKNVSIEEALQGGSASSAPRILHCQKHPQYEVNSYCKTDQTAVCPQCALDSHKGHDVDPLSTLSKGFKDSISTLVNNLFFFFLLLLSKFENKPPSIR